MYMKKVLIFVLAIVMVISMAVSAFAQTNPNLKEDSDLPALTKESSEVIVLRSVEDVQELTKEAKAMLKDACPQNFAVEYFFYAEVEGSATVVFDPIPHEEILFKQFVDGEWVELDFTVNADKTITVEGVVDAPMAVIVKTPLSAEVVPGSRPSVAGKKENLLPGTTVKYATSVLHHSTEEVLNLSDDIQALMAEAKEKLTDACPEGFAAKYFYYVQVMGSDGPATAVYEPMDHSEILFKQYVDGEWVEMDATVNKDGTITVDGIVDAPMAVFTK